jgi:hypothetical protein
MSLNADILAVSILPRHHNRLMAGDFAKKARNRQARFDAVNHFLARFNNLGVSDDINFPRLVAIFLFAVIVVGQAHNDQPLALSHLRRGKTHARRGDQRLNHVINKSL